MTADKREPLWFLTLLIVGALALGAHRDNQARKAQVKEFRETIRSFMAPRVQELPSFPGVKLLGLSPCYSPACQEEKRGWGWAARAGATSWRDCTQAKLPTGVWSGCQAYLEAMQYPID